MSRIPKVVCVIFTVIICCFIFHNSLFSQDKPKCLFISDEAVLGAPLDQDLIYYLEASYELTINSDVILVDCVVCHNRITALKANALVHIPDKLVV